MSTYKITFNCFKLITQYKDYFVSDEDYKFDGARVIYTDAPPTDWARVCDKYYEQETYGKPEVKKTLEENTAFKLLSHTSIIKVTWVEGDLVKQKELKNE